MSESVYLIWADCSPMFKIGYTAGPVVKRFRAIQTMSPIPLYVVGVKPGARSDESALHRRWRDNRVNGEWFLIKEESAVLDLLDSYGVDWEARGDKYEPAWMILYWLAAQRMRDRVQVV